MSVGPSIVPSVSLSPLVFLAFLGVFCIAPAQTLKLAFITAPTHPHAASVAVYPALLHLDAVSLQSQQVNQDFFSRVLRDSIPSFVRPSVGRSVGRSVPFLLFWHF